MNPSNIHVSPTKPDIYHPHVFKEVPRLVIASAAFPHLPEKKKSDKNRNKTQQLSHLSSTVVYIIPKPVTYSYLTHLYDGYKPAILLYLPLSDFIKQTPIHA